MVRVRLSDPSLLPSLAAVLHFGSFETVSLDEEELVVALPRFPPETELRAVRTVAEAWRRERRLAVSITVSTLVPGAAEEAS